MVATSLALSLYQLASPTDIGRALAAELVRLLASVGLTAHQDTALDVLDADPQPGAHVLVDADTAVIVWAGPRRPDHDGPALAMNAPDVMLDSLQQLLEDVGTYPSPTRPAGGVPVYDTHRPSTCEREALVVWPVAALVGDVPPWRDPS